MSSDKNLRLRGGGKRRHEEYPLGEIPNSVLLSISRQLVHRIAIGQKDITGDDFGTIFAESIDGIHRESPLGIADVIKGKCAWSVKTVKDNNPHNKKIVRLISGRNSPDYSLGIENPRKDPDATGKAVLSIWNARVNEAYSDYDDLRILVLLRNMASQKYLLFEEEASRFTHSDFKWEYNKRGNLEGKDLGSGIHRFTWQPHGSQFTVIREVPAHSRKFSIKKNIPPIQIDHVLKLVKFDENWISFDDR